MGDELFTNQFFQVDKRDEVIFFTGFLFKLFIVLSVPSCLVESHNRG